MNSLEEAMQLLPLIHLVLLMLGSAVFGLMIGRIIWRPERVHAKAFARGYRQALDDLGATQAGVFAQHAALGALQRQRSEN